MAWVVLTAIFFVLFVKIYLKLTTGWCKNKSRLIGKTVIITGSNTGIGYETALDLAKRGARVILACRNKTKAIQAQNKIIKETGNQNVIVKIINMSSFTSVKSFANDILSSEEQLDILINNAGAGGIGDHKTEDGLQLLMQINYFSTFLLTNLLMDLLKKTHNSRIINVSSLSADYAKLDLNKLNEFPGYYTIYSNTKLCNILFTQELAKRLKGTGVTTYSLHPGGVNTEIYRHAQGATRFIIEILKKCFFKTREEGSQTSVFLAVEEGIEGLSGEHFVDCQRVEPYTTARSQRLAEELWEKTEEIIGK